MQHSNSPTGDLQKAGNQGFCCLAGNVGFVAFVVVVLFNIFVSLAFHLVLHDLNANSFFRLTCPNQHSQLLMADDNPGRHHGRRCGLAHVDHFSQCSMFVCGHCVYLTNSKILIQFLLDLHTGDVGVEELFQVS